MCMPARRSLSSGMPLRARVRMTLFAEAGPGSCPAGREAGFEEEVPRAFSAVRSDEQVRQAAARTRAATEANGTRNVCNCTFSAPSPIFRCEILLIGFPSDECEVLGLVVDDAGVDEEGQALIAVDDAVRVGHVACESGRGEDIGDLNGGSRRRVGRDLAELRTRRVEKRECDGLGRIVCGR